MAWRARGTFGRQSDEARPVAPELLRVLVAHDLLDIVTVTEAAAAVIVAVLNLGFPFAEHFRVDPCEHAQALLDWKLAQHVHRGLAQATEQLPFA
jgi:hypothetical protein